MVVLKKLDESMEQAYFDFISQWNESIIPSAADIKEKSFSDYLLHIKTMETDPPRFLVPSTLFFLTQENGEILGAIDIRHFLNDGLLKTGGHIGYGVAPKHRGKALAEFMVENSREFIKSLGIDKVLICCKQNNIASAKTIQNCGGILENTVDTIENNQAVTMERYWVQI